MPLGPGRVGRVGVIGHPVAKTAVVAKAVTPGLLLSRKPRLSRPPSRRDEASAGGSNPRQLPASTEEARAGGPSLYLAREAGTGRSAAVHALRRAFAGLIPDESSGRIGVAPGADELREARRGDRRRAVTSSPPRWTYGFAQRIRTPPDTSRYGPIRVVRQWVGGSLGSRLGTGGRRGKAGRRKASFPPLSASHV